MRGGSKPSNFKLNINNETISDPKFVSEAFNEHFNSIASKLAEEIPRVDVDPLSYLPLPFLKDCPFQNVYVPKYIICYINKTIRFP